MSDSGRERKDEESRGEKGDRATRGERGERRVKRPTVRRAKVKNDRKSDATPHITFWNFVYILFLE